MCPERIEKWERAAHGRTRRAYSDQTNVATDCRQEEAVGVAGCHPCYLRDFHADGFPLYQGDPFPYRGVYPRQGDRIPAH